MRSRIIQVLPGALTLISIVIGTFYTPFLQASAPVSAARKEIVKKEAKKTSKELPETEKK